MAPESVEKLPLVPEEVTPAWLSTVLRQPVKSIEFTQKILTQTASKLLIAITYEDGAAGDASVPRPSNICIKGGFNRDLMASMPHILIHMYTAEALFFGTIAPTVSNISLPTIWYTGVAPDQALVIMDDLAAAGNTFGDPGQSWPVGRVLEGVEQLAGLHASKWNTDASPDPKDGLARADHLDNIILDVCRNFEDMVMNPKRPQIPEEWKNYERIDALLRKHYRSRNPRFRTLLHGDPHTGNTFLEPTTEPGFDGAKARFLDWQTSHVGSCFHDIAYFVGSAMAIPDRKEHEMAILDHYLETLARYGGPRLQRSEPDVMIEYRKACLAGWAWMFTPDSLHSTERVHTFVMRFVAQMLDHDSVNLVESL